MRTLIAAFIFLMAIGGPAIAQFAESANPCHGLTQEECARRPQLVPMAIGGPIGSPTFVVPSSRGGTIQIGQAFGDFLQPYIDAAVSAILSALIGWV